MTSLTRPDGFERFGDDHAITYTMFFYTGLGLLLLPTSTFIVSSLALLLSSHSLLPTTSWLIIALSVAITLLTLRTAGKGNMMVPALAIGMLTILAAFLSSLLIDTTIDGQDYHFSAIYALSKGWNPFHQNYDQFGARLNADDSLWPQYYPKGSWVFPAVQLLAGVPIEWAKGQNMNVACASFCLVAALLLRMGLSRRWAFLVASVTSGNPVVLAQMFSRMNDGLLYSSMVCFGTLALLMICYQERRSVIGVGAALIFALNLKFSAIPYLFLLCGFLWFVSMNVQTRSASLRTAAMLAWFTVAGVAVIGYAPYGKNLAEHGHLFYPLMGRQTVDVIVKQIPPAFKDMPMTTAFLYSLFAETGSGFESSTRLKLPFMMHVSELRAAGGADTRVAGFGPLFSGAVVLGVLAMGLICVKHHEKPSVQILGLLVATILASVMICPANWWARYVPQLWLTPVVIALAGLLAAERKTRILAGALLAILLVNLALTFTSSLWLAKKRDRLVREQIHRLADEQVHYCIAFGLAGSRASLFHDAGIHFTAVRSEAALTCAGGEAIASYGPDRVGGRICKCPLDRLHVEQDR